MRMPLNRARGVVDQSDAQERPEMPKRTNWLLTRCSKCHRVSWFGQSIPYMVTSKEPVEQLRRVNHGRGSSKRIPVTDFLRHVAGNPKNNKWRCGCGSTECGVAGTATQMLALTMLKMRKAGA